MGPPGTGGGGGGGGAAPPREEGGGVGAGALADLGGAAEYRDPTAAIALELHARVRHRVPVDRQARARNVGRARQPDPLAIRKLFEPLLPRRAANHFLDTGPEAHRADAQPVGGWGLGGYQMLEAGLGRVHAGPAG